MRGSRSSGWLLPASITTAMLLIGVWARAGEDPPPDEKYSLRLLVWNFWTNQGDILNGPAGQAESTDLIKGHDVDQAGNIYWTECDAPVIRSYRADTHRVVTLAGSIRGLSDGPLGRARFGGWSYNSTNLICVSRDGKHLFVRDALARGLWRHVDLAAGAVETLGAWYRPGKGYFLIAKDCGGDIYAFCSNGDDPPDCKGYRKLKLPQLRSLDKDHHAFDRYALDAKRMRFYWHCRGPIMATDLGTGESSILTWDGKGPQPQRPVNSSGPLESTTLCCPTGMSLSPAGRYLYVGQGDGSTCFRFDLQKKYAHIFGRLDGGGFGWRDGNDRDKNCQMTGCTGWPAATVFLPDGRGVWATCWAMYTLTPSKGDR
jgi:hypothetical protein